MNVSKYVVGDRILEEADFSWWVPCTLQKRDHIISKVKVIYLKKSHKFGIELPASVAHTHKLGLKNKNSHWREAIKREVTNNTVAFNILDHDVEPPVGYKHVHCHLIFDVKMAFRRKA